MTFAEIYDQIIPLWGNNIDISDGYIIQPERKYKDLRSIIDSKDYFYSKNLSNLWNTVEEKLAEEDSSGEVMVWTMFQVFQQVARQKFEQGIYSFSPAEIDKEEIEKQFLQNLNEENEDDQSGDYTRQPE